VETALAGCSTIVFNRKSEIDPAGVGMCDEGLNLDRCETEQKNKNSNTYMMASVKTNDSKASRTSKILKYHEMT
jgi:hypothetical protein